MKHPIARLLCWLVGHYWLKDYARPPTENCIHCLAVRSPP